MAVSKLDENSRPALTAVSSSDADVIVPLYADPSTHRLLVDVVSGGTTTVDAGTTTTGNAGTNASVVNSGTTTNAVFDFTIPRGNTGAAGAAGPTPTINDTSVTSNDIGTGPKTFSVTSATNAWVVGDWLVITDTGTPVNYMSGNITNYTGPSVTVNVVVTGGSGTGITAWTLALSGVKGADGIGAGTVTTVSVVGANGFAGTVANATSTPAITLSTSVTGVVKGNGTVLSAATDGTDYLSSSTGLKLDQTTPQTVINGQPVFGEGIKFGLTPTTPKTVFAAGKTFYDVDYKTLSTMIDTDVTLQIGQEDLIYGYATENIANGEAVYFSGASSGYPTFTKAKADSITTAVVTGVATQAIAINTLGFVTRRGEIHDLNTNAWSVGDVLYLDASTAGALTNVVPAGPNIESRVGRVLEKDPTTGEIYIDLFRTERLTDLADVNTTSPSLDQVLTFNGTEWVNGNKASSSASVGIDFFYATPVIKSRTSPTGLTSDGATGNGIQINSLSKTPVTTAAQTQAVAVNADTRTGAAWLYDTALGRTTIDSGIWDFTTYASVSNTTGTHSITRGVYQVVPGTGTLTITGTNANDRVATITDAQYDGTYFAANASNVVASYIQATSGTDKGIYQISVMADGAKKIATIRTATGYTNETGVTYNIWNKLFSITTANLTSTSIIQYDTTTSQPAFTIATTDKLGSMLFCTSTANRTITVSYDGTAQNTHVSTPLITLHNNLAGLQGGDATNRWHLTATEGTVTGSGGLVRATSPVLTTPNIGSATGSVSGNAGTVTTAAETGDTSCSIAFVTDVSGSLPIKTNTNLTFNASTGVLTSASAVLTTADINGGTADNVTIGGSTAAAGTFTTAKADHIGETTGSHTVVFDNTVTLPAVTILPAAAGVSLTVPSGDDTATGFTTSAFNSGYNTSAIGDLVFMDSSATWQLVDVDSTTTSYGLIAIALEAKASGNALKVALPGSFVRHNAWNWTPGATLYASETAGGIATAIPTGADNVIRVIGFAVNADYIYFYPSQDVQTTVA